MSWKVWDLMLEKWTWSMMYFPLWTSILSERNQATWIATVSATLPTTRIPNHAVHHIWLRVGSKQDASAGQNHDPCQTRHRSAPSDSVQLKLQFPISISTWNRLFHFARNRTRSHKRIHSTRQQIFHSVKLIARWRFDWWRFNNYFDYDIISINDSHFWTENVL